MADKPLSNRIKEFVLGSARNPHEPAIFHKLSLVAFFAWIGLGSDGLSSSCYGPPEAFIALVQHQHPYLGVFVALATAITIFIIATSYSQIIELFPTGGGGYLVASKLLSPRVGMLSGCALMVDYVLTIAVSVASGTDALFSFVPPAWHAHKVVFAVGVVIALTLLNLRGVRESVGPLVPIFLTFVLTHAFLIVYALIDKAGDLQNVYRSTVADTAAARSQLGTMGMLLLILHAYGMGAGTYTGIEAVSNGLPILREPRARTGKRTMTYMWISLAVTVVGLMMAYLLYGVSAQPGKTLNAVLLGKLSAGWPAGGNAFTIVTLMAEAALLFVAAQTGFLGGPRVLASMAADRWFPTRLSMLSDRLVTQNGILLMSAAAIVTMILTEGAIDILVVLYSINVFITFVLSQTGMVRHWWISRSQTPGWRKKLLINGLGLVLTLFILFWLVVIKFHQGGWATLVVTTALVVLASLIRRHYNRSAKMVEKFNSLAMMALKVSQLEPPKVSAPPLSDPNAKTAVLLVSGFNGMGVHLLLNIFRYFGDSFRNFVFVEVGVIDAGNFKGADEVGHLQQHVRHETEQYVQIVRKQGFYATARTSVGAEIVDELEKLAAGIMQEYPQAVFFTGQLLFPNDSMLTRMLHNNIAFAIQRRLYNSGIPFMMLPVRVQG